MIIFDMQCKHGHCFEGWFDSLAALEDQIQKGLVACPVCNDNEVVRIPSTFGTKTSPLKQEKSLPPFPSEEVFLKKVAEYVEKNFDNVGSKFTDEALKIHYGAAKPRNIRGTSTKTQEKLLDKEGVSFVKFPMPSVDDSES